MFYYYDSVYDGIHRVYIQEEYIQEFKPSTKGYFLRTYLWAGSLDEIGGIDKVAKRIAGIIHINCILFTCTFDERTFMAEFLSSELSSPCKLFP